MIFVFFNKIICRNHIKELLVKTMDIFALMQTVCYRLFDIFLNPTLYVICRTEIRHNQVGTRRFTRTSIEYDFYSIYFDQPDLGLGICNIARCRHKEQVFDQIRKM